MKKLIVLSLALLLIAPMIVTAGGAREPQQQQQMTFRWSIATAVDHPASKITQEIADEIFQKTNGAVKIEVFVANSLGGEGEVTDMVRAGAILGATLGMQMFEPYWDDLGGLRLPFTFPSDEAFGKYWWNYAKDNIFNGPVRQNTGMYVLAGQSYGLRHLTTKGVPVRRPEDLRGLRVRAMEQPVSISYITSLGGNAIPIAWAELYMALQTGTVIGQENPVSNVISAKFYEVQDHLILTGHAAGMAMATVNEGVWNTIPAQHRTIIEAAFVAGANRVTETVRSMEGEWLKELQQRGMTILRPEDIDFAAFQANAQRVIAQTFGDARYDGWRRVQQHAIEWLKANP